MGTTKVRLLRMVATGDYMPWPYIVFRYVRTAPPDLEIPTVAVESASRRIFVNDDWLDTLTDAEMIGVLVHEMAWLAVT